MKRIDDRVTVQSNPDAPMFPAIIEWNGKVYTVEHVIDFWKVESKWWVENQERLYVVLSTDRGTMELYRQGKSWTLHRLYD